MLHLLFIWLMFLIGQALSILVKLDSIVRGRDNAATSRLSIFKDRISIFAIRAFGVTCVFGIFFSGQMIPLLLAAKIEPPMWIETFAAVMNTTAAPFLAGLIGVAVDSLLAKIPGLGSYVPDVNVSSAEMHSVTKNPITGEVQTVVQKTEVTIAPTAPKGE